MCLSCDVGFAEERQEKTTSAMKQEPLGGEEAAELTPPACCLPAWRALLPVAGGFVRVALLQPSDGCQRVPGAVGGFSWCPPAELAELPLDRRCWGAGIPSLG